MLHATARSLQEGKKDSNKEMMNRLKNPAATVALNMLAFFTQSMQCFMQRHQKHLSKALPTLSMRLSWSPVALLLDDVSVTSVETTVLLAGRPKSGSAPASCAAASPDTLFLYLLVRDVVVRLLAVSL